jgi:osmotically-inducible protein OsmY
MVKILIIINIFFLIILNYGCSPSGILASGGGTTMVIAEGDRSLGTVIDDATIKVQIVQKFLSSDENLFLDIDTSIIEGRVLLTGIVKTQETRIDAVRRVWEINGVQEVINEIEVGNKTTLKEYSKDLWINTQIKATAAKILGLRGLSYNFETIKGRVYIAGVTSRKEQVDNLIEVIENIKGVNEIVNYVIIKESKE